VAGRGEGRGKDEARRLGDQYDRLERGAFAFRRRGGCPYKAYLTPMRCLLFT